MPRPIGLLFVTLALTAACSSTPTNATTDGGGGGGGGGRGTTAGRGTLYVGAASDTNIYKLDLGTGAYQKLGFGHGPTVTAEGTVIYEDGVDLVESPEAFTTKRVIVDQNSDDLDRSNNSMDNPRVSPDGKRVAYQTHDGNSYVADRQTGEVVARFEIEGTTDAYANPSWTPDGRIVVNGGSGNPGLYISDAGLTTLTRFDQDLAQPDYACVSPDGTKVAFVLQKRVHTINIDGTGMQRVDPDDDSDDRYPQWSPDGSLIAFVNRGVVNIVPAAGGAVEDLFETFPDLKGRFHSFASGSHFDWK